MDGQFDLWFEWMFPQVISCLELIWLLSLHLENILLIWNGYNFIASLDWGRILLFHGPLQLLKRFSCFNHEFFAIAALWVLNCIKSLSLENSIMQKMIWTLLDLARACFLLFLFNVFIVAHWIGVSTTMHYSWSSCAKFQAYVLTRLFASVFPIQNNLSSLHI